MIKQKRLRLFSVLSLTFLIVFFFSQATLLASDLPQSTTPEAEAAAAAAAAEAEAAAALPNVRPGGEGQGLFLPPFEPAASAAILVNEDTGLVVYEKNADTPMVSASLVKLMTAILTIEHVEDLDAETVTADSWVFDSLYGLNASLADIRNGETLSVRELLYALLLPSGNEAALILADYVSGGYIENFYFMMNSRAVALGCTGTTFVDPTGLSEQNITTARDMALIMREFCNFPELIEISGTSQYEMAAHEAHTEPYNIFNSNRLITETSPYYTSLGEARGTVQVGKTGTLGPWQNFACMAETEEARYISVVLASPNEADAVGATLSPAQTRPALYETGLLLDWAFANFEVSSVLDTTMPITEVPLRYSRDSDNVKLLPTDNLYTLMPSEESGSVTETDLEFTVPEFVEAPLEEGMAVGSVTVSLLIDGQTAGVIGTSDLVTQNSASRDLVLYSVRRVQEFFASTYFLITIGILFFLVILYVAFAFLSAYVRAKKKPKNRRR